MSCSEDYMGAAHLHVQKGSSAYHFAGNVEFNSGSNKKIATKINEVLWSTNSFPYNYVALLNESYIQDINDTHRLCKLKGVVRRRTRKNALWNNILSDSGRVILFLSVLLAHAVRAREQDAEIHKTSLPGSTHVRFTDTSQYPNIYFTHFAKRRER
jgi:hypothetical protein